ncbi:MAG: hypothetical protein LBK66_06810 [Spirochaetaceae bacterium]|nr:hypothetical protein [Spirochaetaceae bacterium]
MPNGDTLGRGGLLVSNSDSKTKISATPQKVKGKKEKVTIFTEQNAPKIKKVPLKLYQIQDFPEIGIAAYWWNFVAKCGLYAYTILCVQLFAGVPVGSYIILLEDSFYGKKFG